MSNEKSYLETLADTRDAAVALVSEASAHFIATVEGDEELECDCTVVEATALLSQSVDTLIVAEKALDEELTIGDEDEVVITFDLASTALESHQNSLDADRKALSVLLDTLKNLLNLPHSEILNINTLGAKVSELSQNIVESQQMIRIWTNVLRGMSPEK